jgi:hypothetical protein
MKRLLLALWLGGAALYTVDTLKVTRPAPSGQTKANISVADSTHPRPPVADVASWGPYLPRSPQSQQTQVSNSSPERSTSLSSNRTGASGETASQAPISAQSEDTRTSRIDASQTNHLWAKVRLAATTHSDASVSSPTLRYYPPDTELQVVERRGGWAQVIDPVNHERGWIYEKYYLSWIDGPEQTEATLDSPTNDEVSGPKELKPDVSEKRVSSAKAIRREHSGGTQSYLRTGRWISPPRRVFRLFMFGRRF